jgi:hypothetical protein
MWLFESTLVWFGAVFSCICDRPHSVPASLKNLSSPLSAGKDATEDFEEIGHSNNARELLKKYEIGEYEVSARQVLRFSVYELSRVPNVGLRMALRVVMI